MTNPMIEQLELASRLSDTGLWKVDDLKTAVFTTAKETIYVFRETDIQATQR